jgi:hypothetical protein
MQIHQRDIAAQRLSGIPIAFFCEGMISFLGMLVSEHNEQTMPMPV